MSDFSSAYGDTVEDALRLALKTRGYRSDGDVLTLARRCHFMAREDQDILNMKTTLKEYYANRLKKMTEWLEANQPDVFARGLWDAL